ncbi:MAG: hypothetical protein R3349_11620, partial [Geminicoccaceae bacterium]|nr:hypothetical protein [Geminicoccaceae bacterium]
IIGAVQTGPGQRLIVRALNDVLAGSVEIEGLSGSVPVDMRIDRVAMVQDGEAWLTVEDFVLDWRPSRLFGGVVAIDELSARRIELAALPEGETSEPEPPSAEPFRLPELPDSLPLVQLDRLLVDELVLAEPVLGERAVFHIEGRAGAVDQGQAVDASLEVRRTDQETASAGLDATLALDPPALNLNLRASETGRLIEQLAGLEESGDFNVQLVGNGPLSAWRAELTAGGAGVGSAEGVITLALREQPDLALDLELRPSPAIIPDEARPIVGETALIAVDLTQLAAQQVRLNALRLSSGPITAEVSGSFDFEAETLDAEGNVELERLEAFEPLLAMPLAGRMTVGLAAEGSFLQPTGGVQLAGQDLVVATAEVAALEAELGFDALAELTEQPAARATFRARVEQLVVDGVDLPPRDVELALNAIRPPGAPAELEELRVSDGNLLLEAGGTIDPETLAGGFDLRLTVERLAELAQAAGQELAGRLVIAGPVRLSEGAERIAAELEATVDGLEGLPPDVAGLIGERLDVALVAAFEQGEAVAVDRLQVEAAAFELAGVGRVASRLSGTYCPAS